MIKTKNQPYFLLFTFFALLFLSQAFLFVKWVRYVVPTLPFIYLIVAIALTDFLNKKRQPYSHIAIATIFIVSSIFASSYLITAFVQQDTRLVARDFAKKNIPAASSIMSEVYDMGIVPFNGAFSYKNISLFNFYELDNKSPDWTIAALTTRLSTTDYIILPSQRVIKTRLLNKFKFPFANAFYHSLTTDHLLYQKIYETPCDIFCKITYLGDPVYRYEQTANVFDRPTVMIYKKM